MAEDSTGAVTETELREIADQLELRRLVETYGRYADERAFEDFAELFTADGGMEVYTPGEPEPLTVATGHEELALVPRGNDGFPQTFHFVGNHYVEVFGDTAEGLTYCMAHHLQEEKAETETIVMLIRYNDRYARVDGRWRFTFRKLRIEWIEYADSDFSPYPFSRPGQALSPKP